MRGELAGRTDLGDLLIALLEVLARERGEPSDLCSAPEKDEESSRLCPFDEPFAQGKRSHFLAPSGSNYRPDEPQRPYEGLVAVRLAQCNRFIHDCRGFVPATGFDVVICQLRHRVDSRRDAATAAGVVNDAPQRFPASLDSTDIRGRNA